ncbi:hypothetical protein ONQ62_28625, partial [Salmonella enterica subsp. enterica serovar Virginia]|nr:hypothetical protein [Salmonella enterica subsp. enterica serovar Virginia]
AGDTSASRLLPLARACDEVLFDLKIMDAERAREVINMNLPRVASYRLKQGPIRILSACGSLVVVALYLIAQMVGAGKLIELLF